MSKSKFSQEIWEKIREKWEVLPNISWLAFYNQIRSEFKEDGLPSASSISRKAKSENWEKKTKGLARLSNRNLNKKINETEDELGTAPDKRKNKRQKITETGTVQQITVKTQKEEKKAQAVEGEYIPAPSKAKDLDNRNTALTATKIIKRNRYVAADICKVVIDSVEKLNELKDEIFSLQEFDENEVDLITEKFNKLDRIVNMGDSISRIFERTSKIEAVYWGLGIDDLKDQSEEIAKRNVHIENAQERLAAAKEKMAQDKVAAFKRKLEIIEMAEEIENEG